MPARARRRAAAVGAVAAVAAVVGLAAVARHEGLRADFRVAWGAPLLSLALIALAVRSAGARARGTARTVGLAIAVGAGAGTFAALWFEMAHLLDPLERTGIPTLVNGLYFLPGLLAAALVPFPGSLSLGMLAGLAVAMPLAGEYAPATALLAAPIAAAPVELWLAQRRNQVDARTFLLAGTILGACSLLAVVILVSGVYPRGAYAVELVVRTMSGSAAGWLAHRAAVVVGRRRDASGARWAREGRGPGPLYHWSGRR